MVARDFQTHRIPNWHLAQISLLLILDMHHSTPLATCSSILATMILFSMAKIGMGDIKLAILIIATQGALVLTREFFALCLVVLLITVLARFMKYRHLHGSVAFSHVLLFPFLALYLAI